MIVVWCSHRCLQLKQNILIANLKLLFEEWARSVATDSVCELIGHAGWEDTFNSDDSDDNILHLKMWSGLSKGGAAFMRLWRCGQSAQKLSRPHADFASVFPQAFRRNIWWAHHRDVQSPVSSHVPRWFSIRCHEQHFNNNNIYLIICAQGLSSNNHKIIVFINKNIEMGLWKWGLWLKRGLHWDFGFFCVCHFALYFLSVFGRRVCAMRIWLMAQNRQIFRVWQWAWSDKYYCRTVGCQLLRCASMSLNSWRASFIRLRRKMGKRYECIPTGEAQLVL